MPSHIHSRDNSLRGSSSTASSTMHATSLKLQNDQSSISTRSQKRRTSRIAWILILLILPVYILTLVVYPVLAITSLIPVLGFFSLPTLLSATVFLFYATTWLLYLALAQTDAPPTVRLLYLPWSPIRCFKVTRWAVLIARDWLNARALSLFFDLQLRRVLVLGGKDRKRVVRENIAYATGQGRRLDVYFAVHDALNQGGSERAVEEDERPLTPVVVFYGGGNWTWWRRKMAAQAALRLRRLGFTVVAPELRQWSAAKTPEMVSDFRLAMQWVGETIKVYGGDPNQIHVLGWGSGAHIATLAVVQDAVVKSRDDHFRTTGANIKPDPTSSLPSAHLDISSGIRRCQIWGAEARLPPISGMILVSGVYDVVKQLRHEAKTGIEDLSALRRVCGPSTSAVLQSCPSHLLYASTPILLPALLPQSWLIIHGGKDESIPYSQSVLLRLLLVGAGVEDVRLKLYKDETHAGSLGSLMHQTRYSPLFLSEIEALVSADEEEEDHDDDDDADDVDVDRA